MGENSSIEWTDHTFNPWIGCTKVSDGCKNCYAEALDKRWRKETRWGPKAARERTSESYWKQPARWDRDAKAAGVRRRVFCASLADVFDDHPSVDPHWRADLWQIIAAATHLDWLLLTKRPENIGRMLPAPYGGDAFGDLYRNVWIGTTVEDQEQAEKRIPLLLQVPAAVRFLSVEPQLGPVDASKWMWPVHWSWDARFKTPEAAIAAAAMAERHRQALVGSGSQFIDWVICGGESGRGARPFKVEWARSLRDQCAAAQVPFFCKQLGAVALGNGRDVAEVSNTSVAPPGPWRLDLKDTKGGDWAEWPADLRVRQFPEVRP